MQNYKNYFALGKIKSLTFSNKMCDKDIINTSFKINLRSLFLNSQMSMILVNNLFIKKIKYQSNQNR